MTKRNTKRPCAICGRKQGSTKDRGGDEDGVPLGAVEKCDTCGRYACPDCMHEADCCFVGAEDHRGDPTWAPKGWRVCKPAKDLRKTPGIVCYERT